jgi:hypothetical protein
MSWHVLTNQDLDNLRHQRQLLERRGTSMKIWFSDDGSQVGFLGQWFSDEISWTRFLAHSGATLFWSVLTSISIHIGVSHILEIIGVILEIIGLILGNTFLLPHSGFPQHSIMSQEFLRKRSHKATSNTMKWSHLMISVLQLIRRQVSGYTVVWNMFKDSCGLVSRPRWKLSLEVILGPLLFSIISLFQPILSPTNFHLASPRSETAVKIKSMLFLKEMWI